MSKRKEKVKAAATASSATESTMSRLALVVFAVACVAFLLAELTYTNEHPHVRFEKWFGFNALIGFAGVVALAGLAAIGRGILGYDEDDTDV